MTGTPMNSDRVREAVVADLTDAALEVAARHGVQGRSVDQELELWHALDGIIHQPPARRDSLVAELTDAAYAVALGHGFRGAFDDLQLDLWHTMRHVWQRDLGRLRRCVV
jgi:hypothetical protein